MNELVCIIVPIYNVEDYLVRCIDSAINQTYRNLEIILVNDGSTDGCLQICKNYAKKDNRIKIINKKNGGLSSARNAGLDSCRGEYVTFIDGDDWVEKDFVSTLYHDIKKYSVDMSIVGMRLYDKNYEFKKSSFINKYYTISNDEALDFLLSLDKIVRIGRSVCNKLFYIKLLSNIRFNENNYGSEDYEFLYAIFTSRTFYIHISAKNKYNIFTREGSISRTTFSVEKFNSISHVNNTIVCSISNSRKLNFILYSCNLYIHYFNNADSKKVKKLIIKDYRKFFIMLPFKYMKLYNITFFFIPRVSLLGYRAIKKIFL